MCIVSAVALLVKRQGVGCHGKLKVTDVGC